MTVVLPGARSPELGVFEFVIVLVLISTLGKVLTRTREPRELRGGASGSPRVEDAGVRDMLEELSLRLERLEEERDFYRDLLEAPKDTRTIGPPHVGTSPPPLPSTGSDPTSGPDPTGGSKQPD